MSNLTFTRLTCPVTPQYAFHHGCIDGVYAEHAYRYDSFNGSGALQYAIIRIEEGADPSDVL
jgi:hypothetical protein